MNLLHWTAVNKVLGFFFYNFLTPCYLLKTTGENHFNIRCTSGKNILCHNFLLTIKQRVKSEECLIYVFFHHSWWVYWPWIGFGEQDHSFRSYRPKQTKANSRVAVSKSLYSPSGDHSTVLTCGSLHQYSFIQSPSFL